MAVDNPVPLQCLFSAKLVSVWYESSTSAVREQYQCSTSAVLVQCPHRMSVASAWHQRSISVVAPVKHQSSTGTLPTSHCRAPIRCEIPDGPRCGRRSAMWHGVPKRVDHRPRTAPPRTRTGRIDQRLVDTAPTLAKGRPRSDGIMGQTLPPNRPVWGQRSTDAQSVCVCVCPDDDVHTRRVARRASPSTPRSPRCRRSARPASLSASRPWSGASLNSARPSGGSAARCSARWGRGRASSWRGRGMETGRPRRAALGRHTSRGQRRHRRHP